LTSHQYQLLVIDIDGTLINSYGDVSAENREALALARSAGLRVALSTGRSLKSSRRFVRELPLDNYHIFFDGALVSSPDLSEEIYAQSIDKAVLRQMIDFARSHGIDLELHSTTHYFAERETWSTDAHRRFFDSEPTMVDFAGLWERERIIKGAIVITAPEEEARIRSLISHFDANLCFSSVVTPTYPDVTFINILAPGTSKGKALKILASHLGISLDDVAAVGDGHNDISLLSTAGLAIAMGNAHDELKKVADHVTLDVEEHGLAAAIKRFLL